MNKKTPLCGAIRTEQGEVVDRLFEELVDRLRTNGVVVSGVIQRRAEFSDICCADMGLELLSTGEIVQISQPLGKGSQGCRLDPRGLAEITVHLLAELEKKPDLLILNRFGKGEQDGQGFRQLIGQAVELSIPVLTAVRSPFLDDWRNFAGDLSIELSPALPEIEAWCSNILQLSRKNEERSHG
jgi:nucleoside-triphosphatase THEP1